MKAVYKEILSTLQDIKARTSESDSTADLNEILFNSDYTYIYHIDAVKALGDDAFKAIGIVQRFEIGNFGEVYTDLSDPVKVANMLVYIVGDAVFRDFWDWLDADKEIEQPHRVGDIENLQDYVNEYVKNNLDHLELFIDQIEEDYDL